MNELAGKVALVTGGSRGIGAAIALRLARDGAAVALTYATAADKAQAVAKQIDADGGRVLVIQADNADPAAVTAAVDQTVRHMGRIDILVNNAGIFTGGPLEEMTVDQADRLWAVDVRAVFVAAQAAARHMPEGGRIITVGSALADRVPVPGLTLYAMAKSALTGLTRGLARDLGPRGITVTVVHGGLIDTDMNPADGPAAGALRTIPALGRYGLADDIAATVAHLAGDGGRYVDGERDRGGRRVRRLTPIGPPPSTQSQESGCSITAMNPLSGVLDEAWRMYKAHARHLLTIAFVIYLVAAIITAVLALAGGTVGLLLGSLVSVIALFLVEATLIKAVQDVRDGRVDLSISETVNEALPFFWSRRRSVDPGRHRDHDRAHPDHRSRPVPDHHLGRDHPGHRDREIRGAWRPSDAAANSCAAAAGTCSARW